MPQARVGYEGSDSHVSTYQAADFWKLAQAMDLNNIYYRDFLSLAWHDFAPPGMLLGAGWFGGYAGNRNEPFMRWFPWRALFKGAVVGAGGSLAHRSARASTNDAVTMTFCSAGNGRGRM